MSVRWLLAFILLIIATAVVQAAIPTPPLADDSSLVLRLDFEVGSTVDSALTNYNFEEGDSTGWTVETSSEYPPDINWTYTGYEGNYAVKMQNTLGGVGTPRYGYIRQNITLDPYDYTLKFYVSYWCDYWSAHMGLRLKDGDTVVKQWMIKGGGSRKSSDWKLVEIDLRDLNLNGTKEFTVELFLEDTSSYAGESNHGGWIAFDKIVVEQTVYYGVTQVNGRYGYGVSFDGSNDYVQVKNVDSELFNGSYTVSLWVSKADSATRGLLEIGTGNDNQIRVYCYNLRCQWDLYSEEIGNLDFAAFPDYDVPVMLTLVYNHSTTTAEAYVNGVLKVSKTADMRKIISYINIGESNGGYWKGTVDEFRVYSRALSDSEIQQMYEALRVKFYDESSGEKIAANATIFNANYSIDLTTDEVTKEAVLFNADLPETGEYYLVSSATNYTERYRIVQLDEYGGEEVNVYLANADDAILNKIEIIDLTNSFLNGIFTLKSGDKTIDEKRINQNELNVWFLPDRLYSVYISNDEETRNLGLISYDADGVIQLYITPLTISYVNYTSPVQYNWTYDSASGTITLEYNTTRGNTTSVVFRVYDENGTELYNASATTPSGRFTYTGEANRTYIIELCADNSLQPLNFKVVVLPAKNAVQISVNVEPITTLPEWIRAVFFGGLLIFVSIMFKKTHVPVGLILSLTLAVVFTTTGIVTLSNEVFVVLGLITALSLFIWWREDKQVEAR